MNNLQQFNESNESNKFNKFNNRLYLISSILFFIVLFLTAQYFKCEVFFMMFFVGIITPLFSLLYVDLPPYDFYNGVYLDDEPINEPINESKIDSKIDSINEPINEPIIKLLNEPIIKLLNEPIIESLNESKPDVYKNIHDDMVKKTTNPNKEKHKDFIKRLLEKNKIKDTDL